MLLNSRKSMAQSNRTKPGKGEPSPLSPRLSGLLREAWWLLLVGAALYLALILTNYTSVDPAWSHSGSQPKVLNSGGAAGAWIADVLLYIFGLSTYWWIVFALYAVWWGYKRIDGTRPADRRPLFIALSGFIILLVSSSGLESLRLYSLKVDLPLAPGGMLGAVVSEQMSQALGFTGATLTFLFLIAVGLSLFAGFSWVKFSEWFGGFLEDSYFFLLNSYRDWQDRKMGKVANVQREEAVSEVKKKLDVHEPIKIEVPTLEIQKSDRIDYERQTHLFDELPDSPLPPLHLLDEPDQSVEVLSAETLEFTSRLIERKLLEFGVEVKVLAAYPGPVITRYEIEPATGVKGSQIVNLVKDLARALSVVSIRVVETIPGKNCMALEIPNPKRQIVRLSEIVGSRVYADMHSPLTIAMGKDITGQPVVADLGKMPHVLVAGTTGSGKSVAINAMILSLVYKASPSEVRLILVDPKIGRAHV